MKGRNEFSLFSSRYRTSIVESGNGHRIMIGHADTWIKRLKGLKKKGLGKAVNGLLIYPCSSIHTMGMKFEIDVYFLDENCRLIRSYFSVGPRRCLFVRGAMYVLELKSDDVVSPFVRVGECLNFKS